MQIAVGHTVTEQLLDKEFLSWEDVSGRIQQLLLQGEYAPQVVLDAARDNALEEHAQVLAYAFFLRDESDKEKVDFIKRGYGQGGCSHALSGADNSHADYNGKGLTLARGNYGNPKAEVLLNWPMVAKRVEYLIEQDKYLRAVDFSRMPGYGREQIANRIIGFYYHLPKEIERPFADDFLHEEARKELPVILV